MEPFAIPTPAQTVPCLRREASGLERRSRTLPEETPVALVYGGSTEAVMMATPADLQDFAVGFSLTEGLIAGPKDIGDLTVVHNEHGIELRMWLSGDREAAYRQRRRHMTGPTGCGLCGIESLAEAQRPIPHGPDGMTISEQCIARALAAVTAEQSLHRETHAAHAAGFYQAATGALVVREDVGRHNALDKLAGALSRKAISARTGAIVITSRVSVEMVQKAAMIGAPVLIAISAPTVLAVRTAEAANITLIAVARGQSYQVFSHAGRIGGAAG
jgi:FdhD protein